MNTKQEMNMEDKQETEKVINEFEAQLRIDIEEKDKIISDYEITMKRLQADFDNYVKRTQKEKEDFAKILQDEGIKSFISKGKKIDPYFHEVIEMVPSDGEEGLIVEEIQKGYVMKDHILRTAKVKVSKRVEKK